MAATAEVITLQDRFCEQLPHKPYCTNFKGALVIRARHVAEKMRHIQHNRPADVSFIVFDVDRAGGAYAWYDALLPPPLWTATNPKNSHAHICYALAAPVSRTSASRPGPLRYLAAIEQSMCARMGADVGYVNLICKNPLHPDWLVQWYDIEPYELGYLAEYCPDLASYPKKRNELRDVGLGRNVTLFDTVRAWAYTAVRDYWRPGGEKSWHKAVLAYCEGINGDFSEPLHCSEVKATAKSIARFVWKRFSPAELRNLIERTHTPELQSERGKKAKNQSEAGKLSKGGGRPVQADSENHSRPWEALGISRATYYRRKKNTAGGTA